MDKDYWINRAKFELEKAKKMYIFFDKLQEEGIRKIMNHLLKTIDFSTKFFLPEDIGSQEIESFSLIKKDVLKRHGFNESCFNFYHYLKNTLNKEIKKEKNDYIIYNWKTKSLLSRKEIYCLIDETQKFLDEITNITG